MDIEQKVAKILEPQSFNQLCTKKRIQARTTRFLSRIATTFLSFTIKTHFNHQSE